jgi:hypothetical protein
MRTRWIVRAVATLVVVTSLSAQRGGGFGFGFGRESFENVPYDGKFTFTRIRYNRGTFGSSAWNHDYPAADINLPLILDAVTALHPTLPRSNVFDLEDDEIFKHPIIYMWEPGGWQITAEGAANLRKYLLKGGLIVFDDFEAGQFYNFERQFLTAMPESQFIELESDHPLFHSFFELDHINLPHPSVNVAPVYLGVFEDNDPRGRPMALAFYNNDVAEYWEWSGRGRFGVDLTNDAYKLGVNFMMYALTH